MNPAPRIKSGRCVYVIGDVHGRVDLLEIILSKIDAHHQYMGAPNAVEIFIGDVIDRGPDTKAVIETLMAPSVRERIVIRGNHEAMMLKFLKDPASFSFWRNLGAFETLMSYGIARRPINSPGDMIRLRDEVMKVVPPQHVAFLSMTPFWHTEGDYLFVHAGIRPGVPLQEQSVQDLMWIREPFLSWPHDFEMYVVHGHTPVAEVETLSNRTNIDTGAYASGCLTCLILVEEKYSFLTARN